MRTPRADRATLGIVAAAMGSMVVNQRKSTMEPDNDEPVLHQATDVLLYAGTKYGVFNVDEKVVVLRLGKREVFDIPKDLAARVIQNGKPLPQRPREAPNDAS